MAEAPTIQPDEAAPGWATIQVNGKLLSLHFIKITQAPQPDYYYKICENHEADMHFSFNGIDHTFSYKRIPSDTLISFFHWKLYCKLPNQNKYLYLLSHNEAQGPSPFKRDIYSQTES